MSWFHAIEGAAIITVFSTVAALVIAAIADQIGTIRAHALDADWYTDDSDPQQVTR